MKYMTIREAAKLLNVSPQSLWIIGKKGVLKTIKLPNPRGRYLQPVLHTTQEWIDEFRSKKYSKQERMHFNGRKLYRPEEGEYSTQQAAELIGVNRKRVHYLIQQGVLKAEKRSYYFIVKKEDIEEYLNKQSEENYG